MDHLAVADIKGHMVDPAAAAGIEYQISRPHLAGFDGFSAVCLGRRAVGQGYPKVGHDRHGKARAVRAVCKARASPYVRIAHKLYGIVGDLGPFRGNASCAGTGRPVAGASAGWLGASALTRL